MHHHMAPFIGIAVALFASMTGAAVAITVSLQSARRAKARNGA